MANKVTVITIKAELFKQLDDADRAQVTAIFRDKAHPDLKVTTPNPSYRLASPPGGRPPVFLSPQLGSPLAQAPHFP